MPEKGKKSLPIDADLHRRINIKSAEEGRSMGALIREAWDLREKGASSKENLQSPVSTLLTNATPSGETQTNYRLPELLNRLEAVRGHLSSAIRKLDETTEEIAGGESGGIAEAGRGRGDSGSESESDTGVIAEVEDLLRTGEAAPEGKTASQGTSETRKRRA